MRRESFAGSAVRLLRESYRCCREGTYSFPESGAFRRKTLYDPDFVDGYMSSLKKGMAALLAMPARLFSEVTVLYANETANAFQREIRPQISGGIYAFQGIQNRGWWAMQAKYPKLNALIFLSPKTLPLLKHGERLIPEEDFRLMERASEEGRHWVYAVQRFPSTYLFVICGNSGEDVSTKFSRLLKVKDRFTGFMNRPDERAAPQGKRYVQ
jgi:hypothetical protein